MPPFEVIIALFSISLGGVVAIFFRLGFLTKAIRDVEKDVEQVKACLNLTPNIKK